jgi:hypothetical protein
MFVKYKFVLCYFQQVKKGQVASISIQKNIRDLALFPKKEFVVMDVEEE